MTRPRSTKERGWSGLDALQKRVVEWQSENFPGCQEWELALGVCEEGGELARSILKLHRKMRKLNADESSLRDAIGDIVIFLFGICASRGWRMSVILQSTGEQVLKRKWKRS